MIRAGREVLDKEGLVHEAGYSTMRTAMRHGLFDMPGLPKRVNAGTRKPLYDKQQVRAFFKGEPIPALPTKDHPDDLLDIIEAAEYCGIPLANWKRYRGWDVDPRDTRPQILPDEIDVLGVIHYRRGDLDVWEPRKGAGAGRLPGSTDPQPREARSRRFEREDAVARLLAQHGDALDRQQIAAALGISSQLAYQTLRRVQARADTVAEERGLTRQQAYHELPRLPRAPRQTKTKSR